MEAQKLEDADKDFAPKHMKFFDENGQEVQWEQVTKLNLVRQADFIAQKFFEQQEVLIEQHKQKRRLEKELKIWWIVSAAVFSISIFLFIASIVRLQI